MSGFDDDALIEFPPAAARYPARHEVVDAVLVRGGERVAVVVKKVPVDLRQRLQGRTKGERSFETARQLLDRSIPTPEPLLVRRVGDESWFVARRLAGAEQVRGWFRHRYEEGFPPPGLAIPFEAVVGALGRLARRMHDSGVFFRDFTDGNVLVTLEGGEPRLHLVDLNRAKVGRRPVGWGRRLRDLARPGLNAAADRKLLLESYLQGDGGLAFRAFAVTFLRARIRAWDALKRWARPWRR